MTIIVTLKPTIAKDRDAMDRLVDVLERRLPATIQEITYAIVSCQHAIKDNARAGLETTLRMGRGGKYGVWAEVVK
jgi:hypothetical protein